MNAFNAFTGALQRAAEGLPFGFTEPAFLLLLPLLVLLPVVARRRRVRPRGPWPLALWLRTAIVLLLILALAGLKLPAPAKSVTTVFVVDLSASVPADIQESTKQWVRQALAAQGPDDRGAIVTFGSEARVELPLGPARDHPVWGAPPPGNGTNIAAALELAADVLPPAKSGALRRLVLVTDGNETLADAQQALLRPQLRDVEVASWALPPRLQDSAITSLWLPPALREGEPAEMRVALMSAEQQDATLRVWAKGGDIEQLVYEQPLRLDVGPREVPIELGELPRGSWAVRAVLDVAADSRSENNESWAYTIVGEPARVLLVEGAPGDAAPVAASLAAAKVQVETVRPPQVPLTMEPLLAYESVVLANVHADDLQPERMRLLRDYVSEHGRGLVVVGGERTFGLGEYAETALEEALPVTVQPPDRDQAASLALILVIDRSGSMSATDTGDRRASRMDLAKEGAIQAAETVQEGDQVGVIAFDYDARWVAEPRTVRGTADQRAVADRIATIQPDGGTDIYRAMELAYRGLQGVQARVKHVIVLTDGEQGSPAPFPTLVNAMRRAGITVSTLGIASTGSAATTLQNIARLGQGRYYVTNNARDVPRIMTQEARLAGRSFKQERDFKPRLVTAAPVVRGLVPADYPALHGYVRVSPKPGSETVLTSDQEEAVLSQWQYGLGRAMVWTADAAGEWSKSWTGTEQFQRLWPQAVRWSMPSPKEEGLQVTVRPDGDWAHVRVESFEQAGEFRNHLDTAVDISAPDGQTKRIHLPQTAPGRYEGRFSLAGPGAYFVHVTQTTPAGEVAAAHTTGYALPHLPEYRYSSTNRVLLERLTADTGGPTLDHPADAWRRDSRQGRQLQEVWNYLLMAGLVLFVLDVANRRMRPSRADLGVVEGAVRRGLARLRARRVALPALKLHPLQGGRRR